MENEKNTIHSIVKTLIETDTAVSIPDLADDTDLYSTGMDSLNVVKLILEIEKEFGIEFDDADIAKKNWSTISNIHELVKSKKS